MAVYLLCVFRSYIVVGGGDFSENYGTCGIKFAILILLVHMCIYGTAYLIKKMFSMAGM